MTTYMLCIHQKSCKFNEDIVLILRLKKSAITFGEGVR